MAAVVQALMVSSARGSDAPAKVAAADRLSTYVDIQFAAGAAGDETLAHGVYLFRLKCAADLSCGFEKLTLNECGLRDAAAATFSPRAEEWSTSRDSLTVRRTASNRIELTVYQALGRKLPATAVLTFAAEPPWRQLTDFATSGFIHGRLWPDINAHIDYVPIKHDRVKMLDCPVALPGLTR
jgi:hypothetical protein